MQAGKRSVQNVAGHKSSILSHLDCVILFMRTVRHCELEKAEFSARVVFFLGLVENRVEERDRRDVQGRA